MKILGWGAEKAGAQDRHKNSKSPAIQRGTRLKITFSNASWSLSSAGAGRTTAAHDGYALQCTIRKRAPNLRLCQSAV